MTRGHLAVLRLVCSLIGGAAAGAITGAVSGQWSISALIVVLVSSLTYVLWTLVAFWPKDAAQTKARAEAEDLHGEVGDLALTLILLASLAAIGILLFAGGDSSKVISAALALFAIGSSWLMLHSIYTGRYARAYYRGTDGGIDFNTDEPPCYRDFYYFSFNLGMTYQVSDNNVTTTELRTIILRHCLFSYVYGTVIIATTINLVLNLVG